ncbi:MAG: hypothetical protein ACAH11_14160 [Sphingomonas sp.]
MKRRIVRRPASSAPPPHPSWSPEERPRPEPGERKRLMLRFWKAVDAD